ncbi:hypothetical protein OIU91_09015 [Streptomyces sp. NBC_01456]|uniref:sodium:solute symporter family transporter n=1 Tax=unclassified Streptomyces TaxID=2593676 RepID=UPI002E2FF3D6|nr:MULTISPECIES: hypothetical protein [unclassified Streptomyces]
MARPLRPHRPGPPGRTDRTGRTAAGAETATPSTHASSVLVVFPFFVVGALFLSVWAASYRDTTSDFYIGGGRLTSTRNGLALFGDHMSAAALLGNPGLLALNGYDGIPYVLGPAVAWTVIGLLVAERFHGTGRFTVGDSLADRLRPRSAHLASAVAASRVPAAGPSPRGARRAGGPQAPYGGADRSTVFGNGALRWRGRCRRRGFCLLRLLHSAEGGGQPSGGEGRCAARRAPWRRWPGRPPSPRMSWPISPFR